jgi:hypothetical protein
MSDDENDLALCAIVFVLLLLFGCAPAPTVSTEGECYYNDTDWSGIPLGVPMLKCMGTEPPMLLLHGGKLCAPGDETCDSRARTTWGCVK